jgi:hypothetical protein
VDACDSIFLNALLSKILKHGKYFCGSGRWWCYGLGGVLGNGDFNAEYTEGAEDYRKDRRDVAGVNEPERSGVEVRERDWGGGSDE